MITSTTRAAAFACLLLTGVVAAQDDAKRAPPNVILVMTDDQGFGDFSGKSNPVLETKALDAFALECPKVERFYVSPVCSPTRACLMTGRYNYRTRVVDTWIGRSMMEPAEVTIAETLRAAGYHTGIFGKWHLGDCYPLRPMDQGFDESLVHRGGGIAQPSEPLENERRYTDAILVHNGELEQTKGYCTDVYFERAAAFIDASVAQQQPFFAYIATNAPHDPFHDVPQELYEKYKQLDMSKVQRGNPDGKSAGAKPDILARTFAMIENIDHNFGRLLKHLDKRGIADNTIVIFMTDNGPLWGRHVAGLRGYKSSVYEGGIRSPLWVRWPGRLKPTTTVAKIGAHIDLLPTICEATGAAVPETTLDGRSLLPLLEGRAADWQERTLFIQTHRGDAPQAEHHFAAIESRWKLLRHSGFGKLQAAPDTPFELYDLAADPGEQNNVAKENPTVVSAMRKKYAQWFANVSATRPDNYAPPRIHIGTSHEPTTTLTRQDWRAGDGVGWGHKGAWLLHVEEAGPFNVTLLFRKERVAELFTIQAGGKPQTQRMVIESDRIELDPIHFTKGNVDLRITCDNGTEKFAPYQVLLTRK